MHQMNNQKRPFRIAVICGGPSGERGISLNSARSVMDHLGRDNIEIVAFYVDTNMQFYKISNAQLYSNTPSDFDFKLQQTATQLSEDEFITALKITDITFPAIHGKFGDDGTLQTLLEDNDIPFIGSGSHTCKYMFFKNSAVKILEEYEFDTIPTFFLPHDGSDEDNQKVINDFFTQYAPSKAILKPNADGSSLGIKVVKSTADAVQSMRQYFKQNKQDLLIQPFCKGKEFTVIVLNSPDGKVTPLVPTEIKLDYGDSDFFDFRRKYLATNNTELLCPPTFPSNIIQNIQSRAKDIYALFGMRDFARLDGWYLDDGTIVFSDFQPISGMEQNSFVFQQSSRIGMTHHDFLSYVVKTACARYNLQFPQTVESDHSDKLNVRVLFGGKTAERQVSVMSGTNVWLKLVKSSKFNPTPYFLDLNGDIWKIPYAYALNHTVEEIQQNCKKAGTQSKKLALYVDDIRISLGLTDQYDPRDDMPVHMTFDEFLDETQKSGEFVFLGLHGGAGENGEIQAQLEKREIFYNGSDAAGSSLAMDKYKTGQTLTTANLQDIKTAPKLLVNIADFKGYTDQNYQTFWQNITGQFNFGSFIIKPKSDGCSAGVIRLFSASDLKTYIELISNEASFIAANTFKGQKDQIEMSRSKDDDYLIEAFIETDSIYIKGAELIHKEQTGWIELTVGVLEQNGHYHSLSPSITVAEGEVLSLEEKFQGGTGVNLTPPPEDIISTAMTNKIKSGIEKVAATLGIKNYARIDVFFNTISGQMIVIEANSLPGLTPSTVIYHQGLAETPSMPPTTFLENLIEMSWADLLQQSSNRKSAALG